VTCRLYLKTNVVYALINLNMTVDCLCVPGTGSRFVRNTSSTILITVARKFLRCDVSLRKAAQECARRRKIWWRENAGVQPDPASPRSAGATRNGRFRHRGSPGHNISALHLFKVTRKTASNLLWAPNSKSSSRWADTATHKTAGRANSPMR